MPWARVKPAQQKPPDRSGPADNAYSKIGAVVICVKIEVLPDVVELSSSRTMI
jgi:hypothetical protein